MEKSITIDIADVKISKDPNEILVTYALGSCIAVIAYDPEICAGGMIHYMLPSSNASPDKAQKQPAMFADTGIPLLFDMLYEVGCQKERLVVKVAGGGSLYDDNGFFAIGKRNYTVMRKIFWKNEVIVHAEDVGGKASRTVRLYLKDGKVIIRSGRQENEL